MHHEFLDLAVLGMFANNVAEGMHARWFSFFERLGPASTKQNHRMAPFKSFLLLAVLEKDGKNIQEYIHHTFFKYVICMHWLSPLTFVQVKMEMMMTLSFGLRFSFESMMTLK